MRGFAAFCYAATLWQILVIVWFVLCELLALVAKLSPNLGETWGFGENGYVPDHTVGGI